MLCEYCTHESECTKITSGVCSDFKHFNLVGVENIKAGDIVYMIKCDRGDTVCPCQFKVESVSDIFVQGYIQDKYGIFRESRKRSMLKSVVDKAAYKCLADAETVAEELNSFVRRKAYVM